MGWKEKWVSVKKARSSYRCYRMDIACYKVVLAKKKKKKEGKKNAMEMDTNDVGLDILILASLSLFFFSCILEKEKKEEGEMGWMGGCWGYSFSKRLDYIFLFLFHFWTIWVNTSFSFIA
jgi:hypothetical protein